MLFSTVSFTSVGAIIRLLLVLRLLPSFLLILTSARHVQDAKRVAAVIVAIAGFGLGFPECLERRAYIPI